MTQEKRTVKMVISIDVETTKSVDEIKRVGNQQAFEDFCLLFEAVVGFVYGINGGK